MIIFIEEKHFFYLRYVDVVPDGSTDFEVQDLKVGTRYSFSIMAFNSLGDSGYTQDIGKVETKSKNNLPFANWMCK